MRNDEMNLVKSRGERILIETDKEGKRELPKLNWFPRGMTSSAAQHRRIHQSTVFWSSQNGRRAGKLCERCETKA